MTSKIGRPKKEVIRTNMKTPITYRDMIYEQAKEKNMTATDYMEKIAEEYYKGE